MSNTKKSINTLFSLHVLGRVKQAIATLDLKGTDDTVTKAMEIVSYAEDCLRSNRPVEDFLQKNGLNLQSDLPLNHKAQT